MRDYARELLGITDLDDRVRELAGPARPGLRARPAVRDGTLSADSRTDISLREQGAELLRQSADVDRARTGRIRPTRAFSPSSPPTRAGSCVCSPPKARSRSVDVRSSNLIGIGSQLVAQGLNMIGAQAGCRYVDRVPAYLNNLYRLGLIWFSHEPGRRPDALPGDRGPARCAGRDQERRSRQDRPSLGCISRPFGQDFCDVCLPLDTAEIELLTEG